MPLARDNQENIRPLASTSNNLNADYWTKNLRAGIYKLTPRKHNAQRRRKVATRRPLASKKKTTVTTTAALPAKKRERREINVKKRLAAAAVAAAAAAAAAATQAEQPPPPPPTEPSQRRHGGSGWWKEREVKLEEQRAQFIRDRSSQCSKRVASRKRYEPQIEVLVPPNNKRYEPQIEVFAPPLPPPPPPPSPPKQQQPEQEAKKVPETPKQQQQQQQQHIRSRSQWQVNSTEKQSQLNEWQTWVRGDHTPSPSKPPTTVHNNEDDDEFLEPLLDGDNLHTAVESLRKEFEHEVSQLVQRVVEKRKSMGNRQSFYKQIVIAPSPPPPQRAPPPAPAPTTTKDEACNTSPQPQQPQPTTTSAAAAASPAPRSRSGWKLRKSTLSSYWSTVGQFQKGLAKHRRTNVVFY